MSVRPATGRVHRHLEVVWGTVVTIDVREVAEPDDDEVRAAVDDAVAHLHWVDRVFSVHRPDTLAAALRTGRRTEADLLARRRHRARHARGPRAVPCGAGSHGWCLRSVGDTGRLDPSGYVKGWAAERVADRLVRRGLANVCVNAGGDVVCRGLAGPGRPWRVGVRHPSDGQAVVRTVGAGRRRRWRRPARTSGART